MHWVELITLAAVLPQTFVLLRFRTTERLREVEPKAVVMLLLIQVLLVAAVVHQLQAEWLL